jgi:stalled ribosome rescue protein Dom34
MTHRHVAVWIDQSEAKIFHIEPDGFDVTKVKAAHHHLKRKTEEQGRHAGGGHFFQEVAAALGDAETVLVVGPSWPKLDFIRHVHEHDHTLSNKIVGVETLDHPTDGQLAAYVRHYFLDRVNPGAPAIGQASER